MVRMRRAPAGVVALAASAVAVAVEAAGLDRLAERAIRAGLAVVG